MRLSWNFLCHCCYNTDTTLYNNTLTLVLLFQWNQRFADINHDEGTVYASHFTFKRVAKYMYQNTPFFLMLPTGAHQFNFKKLPTTLSHAFSQSQRKAKYIVLSVSHKHPTLYSHFILETKLRKIKMMMFVFPRQHSSLMSYLWLTCLPN